MESEKKRKQKPINITTLRFVWSWSRADLTIWCYVTITVINMQSYPVFGMYQPDAIKLIRHNEIDYIVSANEGDSKEYGDDFNEEPRVKDLMLSSNFGKLVFDISSSQCW